MNRPLAYIVRDQKPIVLAADEAVGGACGLMRERGTGSVLVVDKLKRLSGIFTGRDAVRLLARARDASTTLLAQAMTRNPTTVNPSDSALDALRTMAEGGFRHLPVIDDGKIYGVVSLTTLEVAGQSPLTLSPRCVRCPRTSIWLLSLRHRMASASLSPTSE